MNLYKVRLRLDETYERYSCFVSAESAAEALEAAYTKAAEHWDDFDDSYDMIVESLELIEENW